MILGWHSGDDELIHVAFTKDVRVCSKTKPEHSLLLTLVAAAKLQRQKQLMPTLLLLRTMQ